jgi:hypothetical protein
MTPEQRALLIKRYEDGVTAFLDALQAVPETGLDSAPQGEWAPREIAHHVADAELVRGYRLRQLMAQDAPSIQGFDEQQFLERLHYYRPIDASLALFRAAVASNLELLTLAFPEQWLRSGNHDEFGEFGMDDWLERAASYSYEHTDQLKNLPRL